MVAARTAAAIVGGLAIGALSMASAQAAVVNTVYNRALTSTPVTFSIGGASFAFTGATTDYGPGAAVATGGNGQVTTIFGQVADYGSGTVFDGTASFASFSSPSIIPFSAADDYIGIAYTAADGLHLGYAEVFGSSLIGIAYQTQANTSITGTSLMGASTNVPEPASVALLITGLAVAGTARHKAKASKRQASTV